MDHAARRERMVEALAEQGRVTDERALAALRAVPRHEFVPAPRRDDAYADRPLPIGEDQTISAPHMVGIMTQLLDLDPGDRVLEIGTGCGYHAAVTAEVAGGEGVFSVEYHDSLASETRERLARLGYDQISIRVGDGHEGWRENAPYDAAYLTCAAGEFPAAVVSQVREGGTLLGPLGASSQSLVEATKREGGDLDRTDHGGVRFVPMQGD
jgi:protein-L-isoaspartate(D-aspartate) O-methyltransferase